MGLELSPSSITSVTLSLSGVLLIVNSLILSFFYVRLNKGGNNDNNFFVYFKRFTMFFGIFSVIMAIPVILFSKSSLMLGLGYVIGHIFLYIACAYLARIWLLIAKPSYDSTNLFRIYLVLGLVITVLNIYLFNLPVINDNGIVLWDAQAPVAISIVMILFSSLFPAAIVFIRESFRQPKQRKRYLLIGLSFLVIIVGGPLHDIAKTALAYLAADMVTIVGFLLMFWGVMSSVKSNVANDAKKVGVK